MEEKNFEFPILSISKQEYNAIQTWIENHKKTVMNKDLYIFGAGIRGNIILKLLEESNIKVKGFFDNSIEKQGSFVKQYRIFSPSEIYDNLKENYILISSENSSEIEKSLQAKGYVKEENYSTIRSEIYPLYQKEFFRKEKFDYILFGDCYFTDLDIDNLDDLSMSELASEKLGKEKTKVLSIHGMCIPSFYYLMKLQIKLGIVPKAVAIIVNIPFCDRIQTKLPQSQHAELLKAIRNNMPIQSDEFDQYLEIVETRSKNLNMKSFSTIKKIKNRTDDYIEKILTKTRYMYDFQEDNENIVYLMKMIEFLQNNHIKPIPFIPALNYYTGIDYFGQEFMDKYCAICENIKKCIRNKYQIEVIDMSFILEKDYFSGNRMTKFPNHDGKEKEITFLCDKIQSAVSE